MAEYAVTVVEHSDGKFERQETTAGGAKTTAAWLRAKADEIDPPRTRPAMRGGGTG